MIPERVRERDLVGYGREPEGLAWPEGARVVVNVVLVYEEGSEYSVRWATTATTAGENTPSPASILDDLTSAYMPAGVLVRKIPANS